MPLSLIRSIRTGFGNGTGEYPHRVASDISVELPDLQESVPETEILYRIGDYERSMVDVGFRRKVAARTGIGLFADFQSFPGEYGERQFSGKNFGAAVQTRTGENWRIYGWVMNWKQDVNTPQWMDLPEGGPHIWRDRLGSDRMLYAITLDGTRNTNQFRLSLYGSRFSLKYREYDTDMVYSAVDDYDGLRVVWGKHMGAVHLSSGGDFFAYRSKANQDISSSAQTASGTLRASLEITERQNLTADAGIVYDTEKDKVFTGGICYHYFPIKHLGLYASGARTGRLPSVLETSIFGPESFRENLYAFGMEFVHNSVYSGKIAFVRRDKIRDYELYVSPDDNVTGFHKGANVFHGVSFDSQLRAGKYIRFSGNMTGLGEPCGFSAHGVPWYYGGGRIEFINLNKLIFPFRVDTRIIVRARIFGRQPRLRFNALTRTLYAIKDDYAASQQMYDIKGILTVKSFSVLYEIDNILATGYEPVLAYPFGLRTIRIGIRWRFRN